jgi:zinc protease
VSAVIIDRSRAPEPGELRPFEFPPIERFTLSNGLPVCFSRTGGLPVATITLLLPGGALRESPTAAGVATLTGSLLESGTDKLAGPEISERLERLGVRLQVGTSWEVSHCEFTTLTSMVGPAVELVASLVQSPSFPHGEVIRLRNQQVAGILQRRAEPRGFANELASRFIFSPESPFSRPLGGLSATVGALTREDVEAYHNTYFSSAGAALVVAGNIEPEQVRDQVEAVFGSWRGDPLPMLDVTVRPRSSRLEAVIIDRPGAVQSEIRIGHLGVPRNIPDYFPITVMNTILGGAFSSRLNLNLREKHGFTYGVRSNFVMRRRPGPFLVSTAVQTEVTGAAIREILSELSRIRETEVRPDELEDARQYVAGTFPLPLQTTDGVAARLSELIIYDLPDSYLEEFGQRTLSVSSDDVLRAARQYLDPDSATILVLGDATRVRKQLDELGIPAIEVIAQEQIP